MEKVTGGAAVRPVQLVNGFEFPASPGPCRRRFPSEAAKWGEIVRTCEGLRALLSTSDRGFYRNLIGLEAMARQNLRDRAGPASSELEEPELAWLDAGSGPSSS